MRIFREWAKWLAVVALAWTLAVGSAAVAFAGDVVQESPKNEWIDLMWWMRR